jgi:signal transduction histidine kinase
MEATSQSASSRRRVAPIVRHLRTWVAIPRVADGLVVLVVAILALAEPFSAGADYMHRPIDALLASVAVGALLIRRRHPIAVLVVTASVVFGSILFLSTETTAADHAILVAVYTVAALRGPRWGTAAAGAQVIAFAPLVTGYFAETASVSIGITILVGWSSLFVFAVAAGVAVHEGRRMNQELRNQNDALQRTRTERIRRVVDEERIRIARDVHDMVAHGVTLMVIHAGAARWLATTDQTRADEALRTVEAEGHESLRELRQLVGSLDASLPTGTGSMPSEEQISISALVNHSVGSGVRTELIVQGSPGESDAGPALALYRIVQEALTNAAKHARGARVRVEIRYEPDGVDVQVTSTRGRESGSSGSPEAADLPGAGRGLAGIAERAALYGGQAEFGPTADGGFRVHATMPRERVLV